MALPYHTHIFEIPTATRKDVAAGVAVDKVVVPAVLGSAAAEDVSAFATAEQGVKADKSVPSARTITTGEGLKGGGSLAADLKLALDPLALHALSMAGTAVQQKEIGALAHKDKVAPRDIQATGTANSFTVLHGDGVWRAPSGGGSSGKDGDGGGDMLAAIYDPRRCSADVFNMDNMVEGVANKIMTGSEKAKLAALPDDLVFSINRAKTALQKGDVGDIAFKNQICIGDIAAVQKPGPTTFLRGDGVWAALAAEGGAVGLPAGMVAAFAMQAPPEGWLICDGSDVSRTAYAALFDAIGTFYGNGDGDQTFSLPDLRGEFVRGWDKGRGVDRDRDFGVWQADAAQRIQGRIGTSGGQNECDLFTSADGVFDTDWNAHLSRRAGGQVENVASASPGFMFDNARVARTSHETRPRNVAMLYCIKY